MAKGARHPVAIQYLPENMDKLNALPKVFQFGAELVSLLKLEKPHGVLEEVQGISSSTNSTTHEGTSIGQHMNIRSEGLDSPVPEQMVSNLCKTYN